MNKKCVFIFLIAFLFLMVPVNRVSASQSGVITASSLNVRKKANSDSDIIKVLKEGNKVQILGTSGSWYKIKTGKATGFVSKKYVSVSSEKTSKSSNNIKTNNKESKKSSKSDLSEKEIKTLQKKLKDLGFYNGKINGKYDNTTTKAVKKFQKSRGLTADGVAGTATMKALKNGKSSSSDASKKTEKLNWFNGGSGKIPKRVTFKVKDCKTGKTFTARRWSGGNHIDAEPYTAGDTKVMKSIYGHWSWRRRPVLVSYNGHVYAGSMNGMPHGTQTIANNNFDGHFCIHFYGSKTHGSKKVDNAHQGCVKEAMHYSW